MTVTYNFFFIPIVVSLFCSSVHADLGHRNVPLFQPQRLQFSIEVQSFKTTKNLIENGQEEFLPQGYDFQTYDVLLSTVYDFSNSWAMSFDLGLGYAESFDNVSYRNSRELKDIKLGLYRLYDFKSLGQLILDGYFLLTLINNNVDKDEVSVSDGISWLQIGAWWQPSKINYSLSEKDLEYQTQFARKSPFRFNVLTYAGFRSRPEFADQLILKIHPSFKWHSFILGFDFNAFLSVNKESDSEKINKALLNQRYNASSMRFNAWNPEMHEGLLWLGFQPNPYSQLKFGVHKVLGVENTAEGLGYFFEWQTSMLATASGMMFLDFFNTSNKKNPKKNTDLRIKNYGPAPKQPSKEPISNLQDL